MFDDRWEDVLHAPGWSEMMLFLLDESVWRRSRVQLPLTFCWKVRTIATCTRGESFFFLWETSSSAGRNHVFFVLNTTLYIPSYRLNKISSRWWCQVRFVLTLKMISCLILTKIGQSSWNHHYYCRILQPPHLSDQLVFSLFHVGWMMVSSLWFLPYTR